MVKQRKRVKLEEQEEEQLKAAYHVYQLFQDKIKIWQQERGGFWGEKLRPADTPPYYSNINLPEDPVLELWLNLNDVAEADYPVEKLQKLLNEFKSGKEVNDLELLSRLQMSIKGVAELARTQLKPKQLDVLQAWESSNCPVCKEKPVLSVLTPPVGKRYLHCMVCGQEWPGQRVGCIRCGSENASKQVYLHVEEFPGVEIAVCQECGEYFKEIDLRKVTVEDFIWEDIKTLPLNYAAENWLEENVKESGK